MNDPLPNFILQNGEMSWMTITSQLEFISRLRKGDRIDVGSMSAMPNDIWTSTWRTVKSVLVSEESRDRSLAWIHRVISNAFKLMREYITSDHKLYQEYGKKMSMSIQAAIKGIANMIQTYAGDSMMVAQLNTTRTFIETAIDDMVEEFPGLVVKVQIGK